MNIIAVDDEKLSLEALVSCIKENLPNETVNAFRKTSDAEVYVCRNGCDIAFLDIEMRDVNGIELAKKIRDCASYCFVDDYAALGQEFTDLQDKISADWQKINAENEARLQSAQLIESLESF